MAKKEWKEAFNRFCIEMKYLWSLTIMIKLNCHLDIATYFDIIKYSIIARFILENIELNCHLDMAAYLNIIIYLEIVKYISKSIKLKKKNKVWKR